MRERVIELINGARRRGVIRQYAIGGAIGAMFYMEPFATKDLVVFTFLPVTEQGIVSLSAIYEFFRQLGCQTEGQYLIIEGDTWNLYRQQRRLSRRPSRKRLR